MYKGIYYAKVNGKIIHPLVREFESKEDFLDKVNKENTKRYDKIIIIDDLADEYQLILSFEEVSSASILRNNLRSLLEEISNCSNTLISVKNLLDNLVKNI